MDETKQVVSLDAVIGYLGIDYLDENITNRLNGLILTADAYLKGAIGQNYPIGDYRSKELAFMIIEDLYDNQGVSDKVSSKTRLLMSDFILQLQMEMRA